MATLNKLQVPVSVVDFSVGMIDDSAVADMLLPPNSVRKAINVVFDSPHGAITQRSGTTLVGNAAVESNQPIDGLFNFRDAGSGTNNQLIATTNGTTYYLASNGTWTSRLTGDTVDLKTRYVTFLDVVARLNGTDGVKSWVGATGTAFATTGGPLDVANWPSGTKFAVVFNARVFTSGAAANPDRLYYSSIPASSAISWTAGNGYVDINPQDGDNITALVTTGNVILVFKDHSMYRWNGVDGGDPNKLIDVGAPSMEAVVRSDSGAIYFFGKGKSSVGVYRTTGGYPEKLSDPIRKWLEAIPASYYDDVCVTADDDRVYIAVGDLTVDSVAYANVVLVYNFRALQWSVFSYATEFRVFAPYIDNTTGTVKILGGDTVGNVLQLEAGNDDNGTAISSEVELNPLYVTSRGRVKTVNSLTAFSKQAQGVRVSLKVDDEDYEELGVLKKNDQQFRSVVRRNGKSFRGNALQFKIAGNSKAAPFTFDGLEIWDITDEGHG